MYKVTLKTLKHDWKYKKWRLKWCM